MWLRANTTISIVALFTALVCSIAIAQTAVPISLQEQLNAQYKLAKVGRATGEWSVTEPGTVLQIQKGGIAGVPPKSIALCPSKFEGGNLKGPSGMCTAMLGSQNIRYLTVGEKVYPVKMDVNTGKDKITLAIFECDSCNGITEPSSYRSEVIFQFPKGYLATASPVQVEDTIGQVFLISSSEPSQNQSAQNQDDAVQSSEQSQPEPQTIKLGQTTDQVVSALGKPEKIVDLGAKQIYVYKDLKITLVNGRVSDVQ
jgi:hypothetical protein